MFKFGFLDSLSVSALRRKAQTDFRVVNKVLQGYVGIV